MDVAYLEDNDGDFDLLKNILAKELPEIYLKRHRYFYDFIKTQENYDVIITDLSLPDAYGPTVITKIRKITGKPIIVLSGIGGDDLPQAITKIIRNAGATMHISKHNEGYKKLPTLLKQLI